MWYHVVFHQDVFLASRSRSLANGLLEGLRDDTYGEDIGRSTLVPNLYVSAINRIGFNCGFVLATSFIEIH